jgi:hydroxyacylglutathione hydrolase
VCLSTDALVLSGDLVFAGAIGRSDFPNSSPADMERSLDRFLELPDTTDVLPGHGPRTTVARERERNPFLPPGGNHSRLRARSSSPPDPRQGR